MNRDIDGWENMKASLNYADLKGANLKSVDLRYADLAGANLKCADLNGANLRCANLKETNLLGTNLYEARLEWANLWGANLDKEEEYRKGVILAESMVGWKKCNDDVIVEMEIPKGAIVFCINGKKCRTNKCKVISLSKGKRGISMHDPKFIYIVGKEIEIKDFNQSYNVECGSGIHFFKDRRDAFEFLCV